MNRDLSRITDAVLAADPSARIRLGTVTALSPLTVNIGAATAVTPSRIDTPGLQVDDVVVMLVQGPDWIVVGHAASSDTSTGDIVHERVFRYDFSPAYVTITTGNEWQPDTVTFTADANRYYRMEGFVRAVEDAGTLGAHDLQWRWIFTIDSTDWQDSYHHVPAGIYYGSGYSVCPRIALSAGSHTVYWRVYNSVATSINVFTGGCYIRLIDDGPQ